ncbi:MAG: hypothetical protein DWQ01_12615 [Planctomycetota bacterium]|nr:MAG: hypothetical protein DWQ01_12615 [Planctomycetota bacterium]
MLFHTATLILALTAGAWVPQEPQDPMPGVPVPEGAVQDEGEYIVLNFSETDEGITLRQFIKICQENTAKNFTIDTSNANLTAELDRKKLQLYGPKRIRKEDFYSFFQTMMKIHNYVCVTQGSGDLEVVVITPMNASTNQLVRANTLFVEMDQVKEFADSPGIHITTVVPLVYANAQSLGTNLRSGLSGGGSGAGQDSFMPLQNENAILIQGYGPFVAWAVRLLEILDVEPDRPQPEFAKIQLHEASAEEVAQLLQDLLEDVSGGSSTSRRPSSPRNTNEAGRALNEIETSIVPWPRDNSLIITASKENMERIKDLLAQLDSVLEVPETNFRVYLLKNISAEELSEDLQEFLNRTQQAEEQRARSAGTTGSQSSLGEQRVVLVSQEETNSLLITATRTKWAELERLLDQLDQRQPQVLIETALIEVSEDFTRDIGLEFANVQPPSGDAQTGFGFTSVGISTLIDTDNDNLPDTRVPPTNTSGLTAGILDGADFGLPFLIAAAQESSDANILSIPSILVSNNRVARVESKDEIPTTQLQTTQGVGTTETFAGYEEAGITLEITPSISGRTYLRLGISLEISAFRGTFSGGTIPPPRATRKLTTTVYLPDGATMWIGGVIRDDLLYDETGIPWLSDIPVLGWVFGRTTKNNIKTTLFFFCTPRIMDDFEELADLTKAGKARAADIIGLDRVRQVDPEFDLENPLDVILEGGEEGPEGGMLDLSTFAAPTFVSQGGFVPAEDVGATSAELMEDPAGSPFVSPETEPNGRNLPEAGNGE